MPRRYRNAKKIICRENYAEMVRNHRTNVLLHEQTKVWAEQKTQQYNELKQDHEEGVRLLGKMKECFSECLNANHELEKQNKRIIKALEKLYSVIPSKGEVMKKGVKLVTKVDHGVEIVWDVDVEGDDEED